MQTASYNLARVITKSDTVNIPPVGGEVFQAIYVGSGSGALTVVYADGSVELFKGLVTGQIYPINGFVRVNSTGTDAGDLLALYVI